MNQLNHACSIRKMFIEFSPKRKSCPENSPIKQHENRLKMLRMPLKPIKILLPCLLNLFSIFHSVSGLTEFSQFIHESWSYAQFSSSFSFEAILTVHRNAYSLFSALESKKMLLTAGCCALHHINDDDDAFPFLFRSPIQKRVCWCCGKTDYRVFSCSIEALLLTS